MLSRPLSTSVLMMLRRSRKSRAWAWVAAGSTGNARATPFFWLTTSVVPSGEGTTPSGVLNVTPLQILPNRYVAGGGLPATQVGFAGRESSPNSEQPGQGFEDGPPPP